MSKIIFSLAMILSFSSGIFASQSALDVNSENQNESSYKQEYLSEEHSPDPIDFSENSYSEEDYEVYHGYAGNYPDGNTSESESQPEEERGSDYELESEYISE